MNSNQYDSLLVLPIDIAYSLLVFPIGYSQWYTPISIGVYVYYTQYIYIYYVIFLAPWAHSGGGDGPHSSGAAFRGCGQVRMAAWC